MVEDSADILFILKTELEWEGFAVDAANDAKTALDLAVGFSPDIIVSDVRMPGLDGIEFIKLVRQIPQLKSVPAIALTGSTTGKSVQGALAAGFTIHIAKPVEASDLIQVIERLTDKKLLRRAS